MEKAPVVVVMVPFLAQGHLNQLLHLSRLVSAYNLPIHIVTTTVHSRQAKLRIHGWDIKATPKVHLHEYEIPHFDSPPPNPNASIRFPSHLMPSFEASVHLRKPFANLLADLSVTAKRVVVIFDYFMSSVIQDVVSFANAKAYAFHCGSAFTSFTYFWEHSGRPSLDDVESDKQIRQIPTGDGCGTAEFLEMVVAQHDYCDKLNSGNLYDTCKLVEGKFLDLLTKEEFCGSPNHWAIGPFNPVAITDYRNTSKRNISLEWLDKQDQNSVIYVSFGSTTSLTNEQVKELALGLENSGQKFLWVLRDADKGDIFEGEVRRIELPKGFEERIQGKGFIVREWAPQLEILAHHAIGGFMSHCGWNSSMESITMGVPLAAWPMHSDQPRNAFLVTEVLKIGVAVRDWEHRDALVESATIGDVVRRLMASDEGFEFRKRAVQLGEKVRRSVVEKGGVTRIEIDSFLAHITR